MKKLLISFAAIILASCTDYGQCSGDKMYAEHSFSVTSVTNRTFLGYDGWHTVKCNKCGLEKAVNTSLSCKSHHGTVDLVKTDKGFDKPCVTYYDYETHREYTKPISISDIYQEPKTQKDTICTD